MTNEELIERARYCHGQGIFCASHADMMVSYGELANAIERLTAQLAEARQAERAAVVAWLRHEDQDGYSCVCATRFSNAIEAGGHIQHDRHD